MRLTPVNRRELIRRLRALGWDGPFAAGRHEFMQKGRFAVPIPNPHRGDISVHLLAEILRELHISREEWLNE
jgi:predicted RNA binding protein YcfA (HicA-like mRNA interferase family)